MQRDGSEGEDRGRWGNWKNVLFKMTNVSIGHDHPNLILKEVIVFLFIQLTQVTEKFNDHKIPLRSKVEVMVLSGGPEM